MMENSLESNRILSLKTVKSHTVILLERINSNENTNGKDFIPEVFITGEKMELVQMFIYKRL